MTDPHPMTKYVADDLNRFLNMPEEYGATIAQRNAMVQSVCNLMYPVTISLCRKLEVEVPTHMDRICPRCHNWKQVLFMNDARGVICPECEAKATMTERKIRGEVWSSKNKKKPLTVLYGDTRPSLMAEFGTFATKKGYPNYARNNTENPPYFQYDKQFKDYLALANITENKEAKSGKA